jgi:hypothetical protein
MTSSFAVGGNLSVEVKGKTIPVQTSQTHEIAMRRLDKLPE